MGALLGLPPKQTSLLLSSLLAKDRSSLALPSHHSSSLSSLLAEQSSSLALLSATSLPEESSSLLLLLAEGALSLLCLAKGWLLLSE